MGHGQKIVDSLKEAVAGNFARVTVGGVTWVRNDTHVDKATAWDELAKKNAEVERLRGLLATSEMTVAEVIEANERLRAKISEMATCCAAHDANSFGCPCAEGANEQDGNHGKG